MANSKDLLSHELISLFDLRKSKLKDERELTEAANEAQRDIRYLTLMFSDGIPSLTMQLTDTEAIRWDERAQKLIYVNGERMQLLEATSKEIRVKIRPHLTDLVKKAREFYSDQ